MAIASLSLVGRPFLTALVVLNADFWPGLAQDCGLDPMQPESLENSRLKGRVLNRIKDALQDFPGFAKIRRAVLLLEPWTIDNGLLTPTLKTKRDRVLGRYAAEVDAMYQAGPAAGDRR